MKNILKRGINSNMLKTIAIIAMVIDHVGFYFSAILPNDIYLTCRYVGRIAMPIFVYLLVQGFFHTKNFKKYISRMAIFAVVTQLLFIILMIINLKFMPDFTSANQAFMTGNILFSFVISLCILKILHQDILIKKWEYNKNMVLKIALVSIIIMTCILIPLDYGVEVLLLSIILYYIEKLKIQIYIQKSKPNNVIKNIFLNSISNTKLNAIYIMLIFISFMMSVIYFDNRWTMLLAIFPIALYNGERGKMNMKYVYYVTFPLQHLLLYLLALLITG